MSRWVPQQPRAGDCLLACAHIDENDENRVVHWFRLPEPTPFRSPAGETGAADWLCCCEDCFARHPGSPR